jgi:hypothetical protein
MTRIFLISESTFDDATQPNFGLILDFKVSIPKTLFSSAMTSVLTSMTISVVISSEASKYFAD